MNKSYESLAYIILFDGIRLRTASGRTSWATEVAAKNSLRNDLSRGFPGGNYMDDLKSLEKEGRIIYKKIK